MSDPGSFFNRIVGAPSLVDTTNLRQRLYNGLSNRSLAQQAYGLLRLDLDGLWREPAKNQVLAHEWWLVMVLWTAANNMFFASPHMSNEQYVTQEVYDNSLELCSAAEELTRQALQHESVADAVSDLPHRALVELPQLAVTRDTYAGIWSVLYDLSTHIDEEMAHLRATGVSGRFSSLFEALDGPMRTAQATVDGYRLQWLQTPEDARLDVVRSALPYVRTMFVTMQKYLAPYLIGRDYERCLRRPPTFEDLRLGFDPWILTERKEAARRRNDRQSQQELTEFWGKIRNPQAALLVYRQLQEAVTRRRIRAIDESYPNQPPWQAKYMVRYPVTFGGRTFQPGDIIAAYIRLDSSDEQVQVRRTGQVSGIWKLLGQTPWKPSPTGY